MLKGHGDKVTHVALTGDGRLVSASHDKNLRVWDLSSGACLHVLQGHEATITHVALTEDGRAVSVSRDRTLRVWDLTSGACLRRFTGDAPMTRCAVTPSGEIIVAGDEMGNVHILQFKSGPE